MGHALQCVPTVKRAHYERRRPEQTTLYKLVQAHAESFFAQVEAATLRLRWTIAEVLHGTSSAFGSDDLQSYQRRRAARSLTRGRSGRDVIAGAGTSPPSTSGAVRGRRDVPIAGIRERREIRHVCTLFAPRTRSTTSRAKMLRANT